MTGRQALLALNIAGAAAAAGFAARGVGAPGFVRPDEAVTPLARFWATSSAVRTWSTTVPLIAALASGHRAAPALLAVAGAVQLGDSALGVWQRKADMTAAPAVMGTVHLMSAHALSR
jgi:hypothetical protein